MVPRPIKKPFWGSFFFLSVETAVVCGIGSPWAAANHNETMPNATVYVVRVVFMYRFILFQLTVDRAVMAAQRSSGIRLNCKSDRGH
jgi:hypothetical protein